MVAIARPFVAGKLLARVSPTEFKDLSSTGRAGDEVCASH
jgi:hypothetical protein